MPASEYFEWTEAKRDLQAFDASSVKEASSHYGVTATAARPAALRCEAKTECGASSVKLLSGLHYFS